MLVPSLSRLVVGVIATLGATAAGAAETAASDAALHSVRIEADAAPASPARHAATPPLSPAAKAALREQARERVTRTTLADGTRNYRYNGAVLETVVAHRDSEGNLHLRCSDALHQHSKATQEDADVR